MGQVASVSSGPEMQDTAAFPWLGVPDFLPERLHQKPNFSK